MLLQQDIDLHIFGEKIAWLEHGFVQRRIQFYDVRRFDGRIFLQGFHADVIRQRHLRQRERRRKFDLAEIVRVFYANRHRRQKFGVKIPRGKTEPGAVIFFDNFAEVGRTNLIGGVFDPLQAMVIGRNR